MCRTRALWQPPAAAPMGGREGGVRRAGTGVLHRSFTGTARPRTPVKGRRERPRALQGLQQICMRTKHGEDPPVWEMYSAAHVGPCRLWSLSSSSTTCPSPAPMLPSTAQCTPPASPVPDSQMRGKKAGIAVGYGQTCQKTGQERVGISPARDQQSLRSATLNTERSPLSYLFPPWPGDV